MLIYSGQNEIMCMWQMMRVVNDCIIHLCMPENS